MELSSSKVYEILKGMGINKVYHANSVITACQFLRQGALLSRGSIERRGLIQTAQISDDIDKEIGVWFDVFTDSVDIHERIKNVNKYGPVLFVLDVTSLIAVDSSMVWITKTNPIKWKKKNFDERWFTSTDDLSANFVEGEFVTKCLFFVIAVANCQLRNVCAK